MKKTRITAGNVDELMEIVRSVQRGEDPDIDKIREEQRRQKQEQRKQEQERRKQEQEQRKKQKEEQPVRKPGRSEETGPDEEYPEKEEDFSWPQFDPGSFAAKKEVLPDTKNSSEEREKSVSGSETKDGAAGEDLPEEDPEEEEESAGKDIWDDDEDFDDDEFERMLDEDTTEEDFIKSKETMSAVTSKASELLGGLLRKAGDAAEKLRGQSREKARKREEEPEEFPDGDMQTVYVELSEEDKEKGNRPAGREAEMEASRDRMRSLERSLSKRFADEPEDDLEYYGGSEEPAAPESEERQRTRPEGKEGQRTKPESEEKQRTRPESEERQRTRPESEERRRTRPKGEERRKTRPKSKERPKTLRLPESISGFLHMVRGRVSVLWDALNQRGIHKREMVMLGAALAFVLLILLLIVNSVQNFFSQKKKSRNVTADKGLKITVEDEPQSWVSSYPVKLKVSCGTGEISSLIINGSACTPDKDGIVTLETNDWLLQAEVKTSDGTKTARIEIPMIDGEEPTLDMKREGDTIILSAADTRSQVAGIYYAVEDPEKYEQLPLYKKYKQPIQYEEGMVYRFFAKDKAGNGSVPVVTTLEDAEAFSLSQTEAALFPGGSFSLGVEASPPGALLRGLKFETMDPKILSVEESGKVTGVGEGTAAVRVSVDGLESQICTVKVSKEHSILVSAIGDCTLGTDESFNTTTDFNAFDAVNGHEYFFRNVSDIFGADDVTFANFEGTLTEGTARESKQFAFKGDPSYTEVLTSGSVEVVTLANNHSSDYGEQSLEDTKNALREADIDYCVGDEIAIREVKGVPVAFIGIYALDTGLEKQTQAAEAIARAKQLGAKIVIVAFHWGSEEANYPDETQKTLAHAAIDEGADLVVGHHPHVLQGIELYKGKYIAYSLGNFCFGGNSSPSDMDTIIFQQTFTVSEDGTVKDGDIGIIPCRISSEAGYNNYQPTPVSGSEADRIIGRLNEYSEDFGQTYTAEERE